MKNLKSLFLFAILAITISISSCTRIDAGHVGLKVNMAGSDKGVSNVTEVTGWVFYMPWATSIEEFPTFTQTADYEPFTITAKGGTIFTIDPTLNYSAIPSMVPNIYVQYRRSLDIIQNTILRNIVLDAYRITGNKFSPDSLINNRERFENEAEAYLTNALLKDGFKFERITSNLHPPKSLQDMIDAKNTAVQTALTAENKVKTAEANAKIAVATANGEASANIAVAKGEYEAARYRAMANKELVQSYTPSFVQMRWIEAWEKGGSQVPTYQLGSNTQMLMQMPK